jgi:hypothetical protein
MLRNIQRIGKHNRCRLTSECVVIGRFWKPYIGQVVGGKLDLMVLIGEADSSGLQPNHYTFTQKMATAMFAETMDISQHST